MQLWTYEHAVTLLPSVAVMVAVAYILRYFLGNKPLSIRLIPIQVISVILIAIEVGKQIDSFANGYDLYRIPLHFCSLVLFMLPIMAFYEGKHQARIMGITSSLCFSVLILMLIYPSLIYSDSDVRDFFSSYIAFHTVTFHTLVLFAAILIVALDLYVPPKGVRKTILLFIVVYCVIASVMAQLLETNFNNFYSCNVPPLETVRVNMQSILGYGLTQFIYVLIVTLLDIGFVQGAYSLYRGACALCKKK